MTGRFRLRIVIIGAAAATRFTATLNGRETRHAIAPIGADNALSAAAPEAPPFTGPRQTISYNGVTIDVTEIASATDRDTVLGTLRRQVDLIDRVALSGAQRDFLKSVPIVMSPSSGPAGMSPGAYSSATKSISMHAQLYDQDKPILLHELLHAYHDQKIPGGLSASSGRGRARVKLPQVYGSQRSRPLDHGSRHGRLGHKRQPVPIRAERQP